MKIYENTRTRKVCAHTRLMDSRLPNTVGYRVEIMRSIVYIQKS